jgi:hypothetical protein
LHKVKSISHKHEKVGGTVLEPIIEVKAIDKRNEGGRESSLSKITRGENQE